MTRQSWYSLHTLSLPPQPVRSTHQVHVLSSDTPVVFSPVLIDIFNVLLIKITLNVIGDPEHFLGLVTMIINL
jgi:hypothetical protein